MWARPQRDWSQVPRISREVEHRVRKATLLPEPGGSFQLRALGAGLLWPQHRPAAGRAVEQGRDPGVGPGPGLTMATAVVGRTRAPAPLQLGLGSGEGEHRPLRTYCPPDRSTGRFASCQDGGLEPRLQPETARVKGRGAGRRGVGRLCAQAETLAVSGRPPDSTTSVEPVASVLSLFVSAFV